MGRDQTIPSRKLWVGRRRFLLLSLSPLTSPGLSVVHNLASCALKSSRESAVASHLRLLDSCSAIHNSRHGVPQTEGSNAAGWAVPPPRYRTVGKELCVSSWPALAYHRRPQVPRPVLQSTARSQLERGR